MNSFKQLYVCCYVSNKLTLIYLFALVHSVKLLLLYETVSKNETNNNNNQDMNFFINKWTSEEWLEIKNQYNFIYEELANRTFGKADLKTIFLNNNNIHNINDNNIGENKYALPFCSAVPNGIHKRIKIYKYPENFSATEPELYAFNKGNYMRSASGRWRPALCQARHRVAIIIPYKNRLDNLNYFLTHMHPFLQRQELEYQVFVVEQANDQLFNKGILMNAGFLEIMQLVSNASNKINLSSENRDFPFDCVIFHDVDLLPEGNFSKIITCLKKLFIKSNLFTQ
jgi:hypothetical protein